MPLPTKDMAGLWQVCEASKMGVPPAAEDWQANKVLGLLPSP